MKLAEFFAAIGPFLEGCAEDRATRRLFYPGDADGTDARRLSIYREFCRIHRFEALDHVYSATRDARVRLDGEASWEALVDNYFRSHPMSHAEINENGADFPEFLAARPELPAWVGELADLEWWCWRTLTAPDSSHPQGNTPFQLHPTVEVRPYEHALVEWLDTPGEQRPTAPRARQTFVLFWRAPDFSARRDDASLEELRLLKAIAAGLPLPDTSDILEDFLAAGILVGQTDET